MKTTKRERSQRRAGWAAGLLVLMGGSVLSYGTAQPEEINRVGQWPGYASGVAKAVAVSGDYAYVAAATGGLIGIDITEPSAPQRVGGYAIKCCITFRIIPQHTAWAAGWTTNAGVIVVAQVSYLLGRRLPVG